MQKQIPVALGRRGWSRSLLLLQISLLLVVGGVSLTTMRLHNRQEPGPQINWQIGPLRINSDLVNEPLCHPSHTCPFVADPPPADTYVIWWSIGDRQGFGGALMYWSIQPLMTQ